MKGRSFRGRTMTIRAVGFDLGHTLNYSPFPLSWQGFYHDAIIEVLQSINVEVTPERIQAGDTILLKYNTRVNSREYEVKANTIIGELFHQWGVADDSGMKTAEETFASFFTRQSELYPDTLPVLKRLREKDLKVGLLTNVAYGIAGEYFFRGVEAIGQYIDAFLPSTEVGFRKPHPQGFHELARKLGVVVSECVFVGDEEVDIVGANRVGMVSVLIDRNGHEKNYGQMHTVRTLNDVLSLIQ
jgi:putative hydrolase of the HAD superfamily